MKTPRYFASILIAFCAGLFAQTLGHAATVTFSTSSSTDTNTAALMVAPNTPFTLDIYGDSTLNFAGFDLDLVSNAPGSQVQLTGQALNTSEFSDPGAPTLPITLTSTPPAPELIDAFTQATTLNAGTNYLLTTDTLNISSAGTYTISLADTDFSNQGESQLDVASPNSIIVTVTPEPSTWMLIFCGGLLLMGWQNRRVLGFRSK